jgi:hypothetical protein
MQGLSTAIPSGSLNYYFKCYDNIPPEADPGVSSFATYSLTSATKLVTSIAAMQCAERVFILLDEDIIKNFSRMEGCRDFQRCQC